MDETNEKTILIVDDEPDIRDVLAISLQDMGYRTVEAENASQAFAVFQRQNPRIVITDIKMPGGDGIELLRKIKHENPETEVIMITGHGDMNLAIRSLKYAATDFITKPINVERPGNRPAQSPGKDRHASAASGLYPQPGATGAGKDSASGSPGLPWPDDRFYLPRHERADHQPGWRALPGVVRSQEK